MNERERPDSGLGFGMVFLFWLSLYLSGVNNSRAEAYTECRLALRDAATPADSLVVLERRQPVRYAVDPSCRSTLGLQVKP